MLLNDLLLIVAWFCMYLCVNFGISEEIIITFHKLSACFFIETALWKWHNEETLNDLEDMGKRPACGIPVFLQSVNTDLS